jgi:hypothetical protein
MTTLLPASNFIPSSMLHNSSKTSVTRFFSSR